jgi:superfamily I DNA/RNA helicase
VAAIHARAGKDVAVEEFLPDKIRVLTMHGAKGLAADVVFIPGLEENVLPGETRRRYVGQVMEAARMLFVSITRARLACIVSYADGRVRNGAWQRQVPSRFASQLGVPFKPRKAGLSAADAARAVVASQELRAGQ